jgi:hypothetical protein
VYAYRNFTDPHSLYADPGSHTTVDMDTTPDLKLADFFLKMNKMLPYLCFNLKKLPVHKHFELKSLII